MPIALDQTRHEWELGHRRLQQEIDRAPRGEAVLAELDAVTAELRRRIGQFFTLAELADAYVSAEAWTREAVIEIERCAGTHFDPAVVKAFLTLPEKAFMRIRQETSLAGLELEKLKKRAS